MGTTPSISARSIGAFFRPTVARVLLFLALVVACFLSRVLFEGGPLERLAILVYTPLIDVPMILGQAIVRVIPGMMRCSQPVSTGLKEVCYPDAGVVMIVSYVLLFVWLYVLSCCVAMLGATSRKRMEE